MKNRTKIDLALGVKIGLVIILLSCLLPLPYGAFELIRLASLVGFSYLAYKYYKSHDEGKALLFGALALLIQPFFKLSLGRGLWNIVDVAIALCIIYLIVRKK
jgi:hypothetical protein